MRAIAHCALIILLIASFGLSIADAGDLVPCVDDNQPAAMTVTVPDAAAATFHSTGRQTPVSPLHCRIVSPLANAILVSGPILTHRLLAANRVVPLLADKRTGMTMPPLLGPPRFFSQT